MLGKQDLLTTRQCYYYAESVTSRSVKASSSTHISVNGLSQLISSSAFIDRKVKFHISPKSNVALKILRNHLGTLLAQQFRGKPLSESQGLWFELALGVLSKTKIEVEGEEHHPLVVVN
jgi:hypothetical protein